MEFLEGSIEDIIYRNDLNGYMVCALDCNECEEIIVGILPFINEGDYIKAYGDWSFHPEYGKQFKVSYFEKRVLQTKDSVEKYLSSGVIKGIGAKTAAKIVAKFGENTFAIVTEHPEELTVIKGISLVKAMQISESFNSQIDLSKISVFLQEFGIGAVMVAKIFKAYAERTIDIVRENPYKLCDDIEGFGFKTADAVAVTLGIDRKSEYRISSGIKYLLSNAALQGGHTFLPSAILRNNLIRLLEVDKADIENSFINLNMRKEIIVENDQDNTNVYLSTYYRAEQKVASTIVEMGKVSYAYQNDKVNEYLERIKIESKIELSEQQITAVSEAMRNGVFVITGGPGTGKTTIIKIIVNLFLDQNMKVAIAAPTGRAAKRITEATGFEAKTIHRLLEVGYSGDNRNDAFGRNSSNPINADVIILDEVSMVDILLMSNLLKATKEGSRLILTGDTDQLPSIGAGNVLKDIILSEAVKTIRLTDIFRQDQQSMIVVNSHRINSGLFPICNDQEKDFFFIKNLGQEQIKDTIVDLCYKRLPESYGYNPLKDIQVLSPTKKGTAGTFNLNIEIQKVINPKSSYKKDRKHGMFTFREGDKVMQTKNNYNAIWEKMTDNTQGLGVFNGDMGIVRSIDNESHVMQVIFDEDKVVKYAFSMLDELLPSYAITVHKSQGGEFPAVIIPVTRGSRFLMTRNLIYTAVTRAKEIVVLVGSDEILREMIQNDEEILRYSGLERKIRGINV